MSACSRVITLAVLAFLAESQIISPTSIAPNVTSLQARVPIGEDQHALPILSQLGNDTTGVRSTVQSCTKTWPCCLK